VLRHLPLAIPGGSSQSPVLPSRELESIAALIESKLVQRTAQFLLRQRTSDVKDMRMQCVSAVKIDRVQRSLKEDGYEIGPPITSDVVLIEGQVCLVILVSSFVLV